MLNPHRHGNVVNDKPPGEGEPFNGFSRYERSQLFVADFVRTFRDGGREKVIGMFRAFRLLLVGKGVALPPLPPRCRDRVDSLYLPACRLPTPGDPRR
jgi:hypothetical protein